MDTYIICALHGDQEAFMQLYDEYGEKALRLSMGITRQRQLAEDAVQEAFLRAYRKGHQFKKNENFGPWFYRIVINESKRALSRHPLTVELNEDVANKASFTEQVHLNMLVEQCLLMLSEEHRIVLSLKFLMGYSEAEIAQVLKKPVGTIKSRLYYAKQAMSQIVSGGDIN